MRDEDIHLRIMLCDPDENSATILASVLKGLHAVDGVDSVAGITGAKRLLGAGQFNTMFVDPISLGLDDASEFIFSVRRTYPEVVFVLFADRSRIDRLGPDFYRGERARFRHYFLLDKRTPLLLLHEEVVAMVRMCRFDLQGAPPANAAGREQNLPPAALQGPERTQIRDSFYLNLKTLEEKIISSRSAEDVRRSASELIDEIRKIDTIGDIDPQAAVAKARAVTESIVTPLYRKHVREGSPPLFNMIEQLQQKKVLPAKIASYFHTVRTAGNLSIHYHSHDPTAITLLDVKVIAMITANIVDWYISSSP